MLAGASLLQPTAPTALTRAHASRDNVEGDVPSGYRGGERNGSGRGALATPKRLVPTNARNSSYPSACPEPRGSSGRPPLLPCCVVALLSVDSRERTFCALRPTSRYSAASIAHGARGETREIASSRRQPARTLAPRGWPVCSGRAQIPPRG